MFMRKMRGSARYVMGFMALAFAGWLVFDGINAMQGGGSIGVGINPVVGEVAGRSIRYSQWNLFLQNQLDVSRQTGRGMTEEDIRLITDGAWESLISATLLQGELDRMGIRVTDFEVRQAFYTQPPQELFSHPAFQTDGQFDVEKYRRFFTDPATDENQLLQIESYYRSLLPRAKLQALIESGMYVSDNEAWEFYRDTNETARVRFVRIEPAAEVPDSAVVVTDADVRAFYNEREDEFRRPASARTNVVSVALRPSAADTAAARQRAEALRDRVQSGEEFADVATAESADPVSAAEGGFMGNRPSGFFDPTLVAAAEDTDVGELTDPVLSAFGFHVLRVDERSADSLALSQIYVAIEPSATTEDSIFGIMDLLEEIALREDLATAADSVGINIRTDLQLIDGIDFVVGAGALGVAPDWALAPDTEIGELSQFFENATGFHVFELLGRRDEGPIPLAEATPGIRSRLLAEKKKEKAAEIAIGLVEALEGGTSWEDAAARFGWTVEETETFRRGDFVPGLGQGTEAIGEAFGAPIGSISGVVDAGATVAVIEVLEREDATRIGFEEVKEALLVQLRFERTRDYVQRWLAALREDAVVEDHRARLIDPEAS